ncbi:MAG: hypothetical protein IT406_01920 [Candidatus Yanofskybacteria bacterium]|nr:hypothetical protein [Candidatus Yanofskybacteria bacterium]
MEKDVRDAIEDLALVTAREFQTLREDLKQFATKEDLKQFATKEDLAAGFSMVMDIIRPMRRDYEALKDDLAPRMDSVEQRLLKVEHKVA